MRRASHIEKHGAEESARKSHRQDSRRGSYAFRTRSSEKSGAMTHAQYKTRWCARPCTHFHARAAHTPTLGLCCARSRVLLRVSLALAFVAGQPGPVDPLFLRRRRGARYASWNLGLAELGTGPKRAEGEAIFRRDRRIGRGEPALVSISPGRP